MNTVDARRARRECNIVARHTKSMTSTIQQDSSALDVSVESARR